MDIIYKPGDFFRHRVYKKCQIYSTSQRHIEILVDANTVNMEDLKRGKSEEDYNTYKEIVEKSKKKKRSSRKVPVEAKLMDLERMKHTLEPAQQEFYDHFMNQVPWTRNENPTDSITLLNMTRQFMRQTLDPAIDDFKKQFGEPDRLMMIEVLISLLSKKREEENTTAYQILQDTIALIETNVPYNKVAVLEFTKRGKYLMKIGAGDFGSVNLYVTFEGDLLVFRICSFDDDVDVELGHIKWNRNMEILHFVFMQLLNQEDHEAFPQSYDLQLKFDASKLAEAGAHTDYVGLGIQDFKIPLDSAAIIMYASVLNFEKAFSLYGIFNGDRLSNMCIDFKGKPTEIDCGCLNAYGNPKIHTLFEGKTDAGDMSHTFQSEFGSSNPIISASRDQILIILEEIFTGVGKNVNVDFKIAKGGLKPSEEVKDHPLIVFGQDVLIQTMSNNLSLPQFKEKLAEFLVTNASEDMSENQSTSVVNRRYFRHENEYPKQLLDSVLKSVPAHVTEEEREKFQNCFVFMYEGLICAIEKHFLAKLIQKTEENERIQEASFAMLQTGTTPESEKKHRDALRTMDLKQHRNDFNIVKLDENSSLVRKKSADVAYIVYGDMRGENLLGKLTWEVVLPNLSMHTICLDVYSSIKNEIQECANQTNSTFEKVIASLRKQVVRQSEDLDGVHSMQNLNSYQKNLVFDYIAKDAPARNGRVAKSNYAIEISTLKELIKSRIPQEQEEDEDENLARPPEIEDDEICESDESSIDVDQILNFVRQDDSSSESESNDEEQKSNDEEGSDDDDSS